MITNPISHLESILRKSASYKQNFRVGAVALSNSRATWDVLDSGSQSPGAEANNPQTTEGMGRDSHGVAKNYYAANTHYMHTLVAKFKQ